ncbi:MAG: metallophosphoesterase, partial [Muribaculaceae bacterium]|nr:metallophosphoesterase [Muribaculaceae bacterium]
MNAEKRQVKVRIIETSDVHGNFFPYDFINRQPGTGSLARVHSAVENARKELGKENVILVDNGDILQGQPTAYYYNFIDTVSPHVASEMMDFMGYDLATLGNHDIETGHEVYDRWIKTSGHTVLGANIIDTRTGKPYVDPYKIIERNGLKIAFLGMITPGIPGWLPENLWEGLKFEEMLPAARKWVSYIRTYEKPDVIVGLFHSGRDHTKTTGDVVENASMLVAEEVPGFDVVMMGHDHSKYLDFVKNSDGKNVLVGNPANNADLLFTVDIEAEIDETGKVGDLVI